jgi:subtilisin family serine protease
MMNQHKKIKAEVVVYDSKKSILSNAKATLKPLEKPNEIIHLQYDESKKLYKTNEINFENYKLKVEADSFRTEEREVKVDPIDGLKDTIIMIKEGQPFFYRGNVKVPFEPRNDVIAVAMSNAQQLTDSDDLTDYTENLNLENIPISNSISKSGVRVFKIKPSATNENIENIDSMDKIGKELTKNPAIELAGPILQMNDDSISFLTNEIIVEFKENVNKEEITFICNQNNLELIRKIPNLDNTFILRSKTQANYDLLKVCEQIVQSGKVEFAEPNIYSTVVEDSVTPSDFLFSKQWHIPVSTVDSAWSRLKAINQDITFGSPDIIIAVIDSGIDSNHPEFNGTVSNGKSKIYKLFDFNNMVPNNNSLAGTHGTCCAGVAIGSTNNQSEISGESEGIAGAAGNCRVIGIRTPGGIQGKESEYAATYMWAAGFESETDPQNPLPPGFPTSINPGADIITSSYGYSIGYPISGLMSRTFDKITANGRGGKGTLLFFSAGNDNIFFDFERPWAAYNKTFAIAASSLTEGERREIRATYSNYANAAIIDLCAPSNDGDPRKYFITTTTTLNNGDLPGHTGGGNNYRSSFGGTSSATPLSAGIAALVLTANPNLNWREVRDILRDTAVKIDANNTDQIGRWKDINDNTSSDPGYLGPYYSKWYGYGRIDAEAAVKKALNQ